MDSSDIQVKKINKDWIFSKKPDIKSDIFKNFRIKKLFFQAKNFLEGTMKKIFVIVLSCLMVFCTSVPSVMADTDQAPVAGTTDTIGTTGAAAGAAASASQWGMLAGGTWLTGAALVAAVAAGLIVAFSDDDPAAHTHSH